MKPRWRLWLGVAGVAVLLVALGMLPFSLSGITQPQTQFLAGLMVLCAGCLGFLGTHLTRVSTEEKDLREHYREVESDLRARFSAAATQLSDSKTGIRQAGAYALAALANDWRIHGQQTGNHKLAQSEQQVCIHILCAYLRSPQKQGPQDTEVKRTIIELLRVGTIIGKPIQGFSWRGLSFNLSNASLTSADLQHSDLSGADLSRAKLKDSSLLRADLSGANLSHADLSAAKLVGANLSGCQLEGANLSNADLRGVNLRDATWNVSTVWPSGFSPPSPTGEWSKYERQE